MNDAPERPVHEQAVPGSPWRSRLHEIIFEADTPSGKIFDVALLLAILISVVVVMLESIQEYRAAWGPSFGSINGVITLLFAIEYALRIICVRRPLRYVFSFFGIVDFLAVAAGLLPGVVEGPQSLMVLRSLRLLRVFHVFKMGPYVAETRILITAIRATKAKIVVFVLVVATLVLILGTVVYVVENPNPDQVDPNNKFTSIPKSVYWAIVTVTTVGYGDMAPRTVIGQLMAALAMLLGYSMIIVPVAIFSVEVLRDKVRDVSTQSCPKCTREGHDVDAVYCKYCGEKI